MVLSLLALAPWSLSLRTATGGVEIVAPTRDRRATVVLIVLAECPIARGYSPEMARLAREYGTKGVRFVMAFADGSPAAWTAQMRAFGLGFPAARADAALIRRLGAKAVPTAAVVGADGALAYVGRIDDRYPALGVQREPRRRDLRLALDAFLSGRRGPTTRTAVVGCALPPG